VSEPLSSPAGTADPASSASPAPAHAPHPIDDGETSYDALLLLSFGGPEQADEVMPFLERVTAGRGVPQERLEAVAEHYYANGGASPINGQNRLLLSALEAELADLGLRLYWGNRNWHPLLADTVAQMRDDGVRRALAFVTSAYGSYSGCRQYLDDLTAARLAVGPGAPPIDKLRLFFNHPGFVEPLADRLAEALAEAGPGAVVLFSAHSIPEAMAAASPYVEQLTETATLVAERAGGPPWRLVWQSRSGPPQVPWLEPDVVEVIQSLAAPAVVVAPIGFVSDHMEVIHDLDTEAAEAARACGLRFVRAGTVGTDERFVAMIRELVLERLRPGAPVRTLGRFPAWAHTCPEGHCPAPRRPSPGPATP
jgi:ferrochelatase